MQTGGRSVYHAAGYQHCLIGYRTTAAAARQIPAQQHTTTDEHDTAPLTPQQLTLSLAIANR